MPYNSATVTTVIIWKRIVLISANIAISCNLAMGIAMHDKAVNRGEGSSCDVGRWQTTAESFGVARHLQLGQLELASLRECIGQQKHSKQLSRGGQDQLVYNFNR